MKLVKKKKWKSAKVEIVSQELKLRYLFTDYLRTSYNGKIAINRASSTLPEEELLTCVMQ